MRHLNVNKSTLPISLTYSPAFSLMYSRKNNLCDLPFLVLGNEKKIEVKSIKITKT